MEKVNWTQKALNWLSEIYHYIAQDNPKIANSILDKISEQVDLLNKFPELGYRYQDIPNRHIRILLVGHYRVAYEIFNDGHIDVLGIYHGSLNIKRHLK